MKDSSAKKFLTNKQDEAVLRAIEFCAGNSQSANLRSIASRCGSTNFRTRQTIERLIFAGLVSAHKAGGYCLRGEKW